MWRYLGAVRAWVQGGRPTELYGHLDALWYAMSPEERDLARKALRVGSAVR